MGQNPIAIIKKYKYPLIIIGLGFFAYFNALFNEFVWDDIAQIVASPFTHSLKQIPIIFTAGQGIFYRPFFYTFLTTIYSFFGPNVFSFHLTQVILHIANTWLFYLLLVKHLNKKLSFIAALIFLIHPMNVEAVSYISAISDPLFVFSGLLAFHILLRWPEKLISYILASLLFLLALLTKEASIVLIILIFLYFLIFQRKQLILLTVAAVISIAIYFFLRFFVAHTTYQQISYVPIANLPLLDRIRQIPKVISHYLITFIFPVKLSIAQHWLVSSLNWRDFFLPLIIVVLFFSNVFFAGWKLLAKNRRQFLLYFYFFLWFFISLLPYLHIVPIDMTVAERWFYLPMMGLLAMAAIGLQQIKLQNRHLHIFATVLLIFIFVFFSLRTLMRNNNWFSQYTLYAHDIRISPESFDLQNGMSQQLYQQGKLEEALPYAEKAIQLAPRWASGWNTAGTIYMQKKQYEKGIKYFSKALENDGGCFQCFYNLIYAHILMENYTGAKGWSEQALKSFHNEPTLLLFLAIAESKLGNQARALGLAKRSYELNPTQQSTYIYNSLLNNQPVNIE